MSFPDDVRERAFVACGRRCCICHKFCGTNMEVHHIHPRAQGGKDTFDNAIPLCFDCHANVGHYNPSHPKGNKFSEKELKAHRDEWYNRIKKEKTTESSQEKLEKIKICKTSTSEPDSLISVSSGKELISFANNACALDFECDEPENSEEQELILKTTELIQRVLDDISFIDLTQIMSYAFELSGYIKKLHTMNYMIFAGKAKRVVKGGVRPPDIFPVWIIRILKKDNPNIVMVEGEKNEVTV